MRVQARVRLSCCWILPRHSYEPCLIRTEIGHVGCCKRLPSRPGFQLRSLRLTEGVNGGEKQNTRRQMSFQWLLLPRE
jgi:hypothetical protein